MKNNKIIIYIFSISITGIILLMINGIICLLQGRQTTENKLSIWLNSLQKTAIIFRPWMEIKRVTNMNFYEGNNFLLMRHGSLQNSRTTCIIRSSNTGTFYTARASLHKYLPVFSTRQEYWICNLPLFYGTLYRRALLTNIFCRIFCSIKPSPLLLS